MKKVNPIKRDKKKDRAWIKSRNLFLQKRKQLKSKAKIEKRKEKKKSKQRYLNEFS